MMAQSPQVLELQLPGFLAKNSLLFPCYVSESVHVWDNVVEVEEEGRVRQMTETCE